MTSASHRIEPQRRRRGKGWTACQPWQAGRFAVVQAKSGTLIAQFPTQREAEAALRRLAVMAQAPKPRIPGQRWGTQPVASPVAASLHLDHDAATLQQQGHIA